MNQLEAKKRALAAESEVYRETLKLELHNLRIYTYRFKHRVKSFTSPNSLFMLAAPLAGAFLKKRRGFLLRKMAMALVSWQLFRRLVPFLAGLFSPTRGSVAPSSSSTEESVETSKR